MIDFTCRVTVRSASSVTVLAQFSLPLCRRPTHPVLGRGSLGPPAEHGPLDMPVRRNAAPPSSLLSADVISRLSPLVAEPRWFCDRSTDVAQRGTLLGRALVGPRCATRTAPRRALLLRGVCGVGGRLTESQP
ncbi:hypothetical protein MRX96_036983 [Rhipicephalus microplus]